MAHASKTRRSLFGLRVLGEDGTSEGLRHLGSGGRLGGPPKQPSELRPEVHMLVSIQHKGPNSSNLSYEPWTYACVS